MVLFTMSYFGVTAASLLIAQDLSIYHIFLLGINSFFLFVNRMIR